MTIHSRLLASLRDTPLLPRDVATAELAKMYARHLDLLFERLKDAEVEEDNVQHKRTISEIDVIGRRLQDTLDRLGMSPGARPAVRDALQEAGGGGRDPDAVALDRARADAAAGTVRIDYAATVDPAVAAADAGD